MNRRPPSLRKIALLLTLPVLLLAGMGVWVIKAERARVEADFSRMAAERADAMMNELRSKAVQDAVLANGALMPRWRFVNEETPEPSPHYASYEAARVLLKAGKLSAASLELQRLLLIPEINDQHSPGGLPMPVLIHRMLMDADPAQAADHARRLYESCQRLPFPLMRRLLEDALPFLPPDGERWADDDWGAGNAEALFGNLVRLSASRQTIHEDVQASSSGGDEPEPFSPDRGGWLGEWHVSWQSSDWVLLLEPRRVGEVIERMLMHWGGDAQIAWHGHGVYQFGSGDPTMIVREAGPWRVSVLQKEGWLLEQIEERTSVLKWVMANVLLVVVVAMWLTYRAFKKQAELARLQAEFVASVSHELRTPVAGIGALAERLESGTADAEQTTEYHRMIAREGRRLAALVDNVLDFSRIERGAKAYDFDHADLPRLIRETASLLRPVAEEKGLTLVEEIADVPEDRWPLVDTVALRQALVNLMDNAIKFTPAGGTVTVGMGMERSNQAGNFCLYVKDTGIGIPAVEQARIFEKFYRVDNGLRRETTGAGIGLSIVKHIAEAHGARVTVESEVGKFSVFRVQFPVPITEVTSGNC